MKKMALVILGLSLLGANSWAGCTTDASQVISTLKQFDSRVSEQSHATVKTNKENPAKTVSLSDLLGFVKRACASSGSASLVVMNPEDNKPITISFSKKAGGTVYATSNGKSAKVEL